MTISDNAHEEHYHHGRTQLVIDVNGIERGLCSAHPDGRELLHAFGFHPPDEFVLIQQLKHGARSIRLDEQVQLVADRVNVFRAFRNDRVFRFMVGDHEFEWGQTKISEAELRFIAHVAEDATILVVLGDGIERELQAGDQLDLGAPKTEHLQIRKRLLTVYVDNEPKKISAGTYTTEQLIEKLGVSPGYLLNIVNAQGQLQTLKPGEPIYVVKHEKFFTQVPCGGSS